MDTSPRQRQKSHNPQIQTVQIVCSQETQRSWRPSHLSLPLLATPVVDKLQTGYQLALDTWPAVKGPPMLAHTCLTASVLSMDVAIAWLSNQSWGKSYQVNNIVIFDNFRLNIQRGVQYIKIRKHWFFFPMLKTLQITILLASTHVDIRLELSH